MDKATTEETYISLQKLLHEDSVKPVACEADLELWLTERIVYMLLHEMEKLLQLLYRIDVNESKVKACFAQNDPKKIAPMLARLMIEREKQKAETRKKFK